VFIEVALRTREVEAAVREISNVLDAEPRDAAPDATVKASALMVLLFPAMSFGVVIDRAPLLVV